MPALATFPADFFTILISAYWLCAIAGGGLILMTILLGETGGDSSHTDVSAGGLDADIDADFADADFTDMTAETGPHALSLSSWFSLRFLLYAAATFGVVGLVFTYFGELSRGAVLAVALVAGLLVGQGVHQLFRLILRSSGNALTRAGDYVQRVARVTVAIEPDESGEVALDVRGTERYLSARAVGAVRSFAVGSEVIVTGYRAGVLHVVAREELQNRRVSAAQ